MLFSSLGFYLTKVPSLAKTFVWGSFGQLFRSIFFGVIFWVSVTVFRVSMLKPLRARSAARSTLFWGIPGWTKPSRLYLWVLSRYSFGAAGEKGTLLYGCQKEDFPFILLFFGAKISLRSFSIACEVANRQGKILFAALGYSCKNFFA
jgi:hypothetical protein